MSKSKEEITRDVEKTRSQAKRAVEEVEEVWSGKNAIASAWRSTKDTCFRAQDKVIETKEAIDERITGNIYSSIGIAFGVGAMAGYIVTRRARAKPKRSRKRKY